jgi:DNA anti-recombination protein RmuC
MTIDERLERLTERHEALAQTMELMGHQLELLMEAIAQLVNVATNHERRLDRLEGKI